MSYPLDEIGPLEPNPEPAAETLARIMDRMPNPWTALIWTALAVFCGWVAVWALLPLIVYPVWFALAPSQSSDWATGLHDFRKTAVGVVSGTLVMQGAACAVVIARTRRDLAKAGPAARLGLGPSRVGWWAWPMFLASTWAIAWGGTLVAWLGQRLGLLPVEAPRFDASMKALSGVPIWGAVAAALLLGGAAGIGEELVMRGFLQRRLMRRWRAGPSILITSLFFAALHLDLSHIVGVLPTGLWLGYLAWRCDSIRPTIAAHAALDASYFLLALLPGEFASSFSVAAWPLMLLSIVCIPGTLVLLEFAARRHGRQGSTNQPAAGGTTTR